MRLIVMFSGLCACVGAVGCGDAESAAPPLLGTPAAEVPPASAPVSEAWDEFSPRGTAFDWDSSRDEYGFASLVQGHLSGQMNNIQFDHFTTENSMFFEAEYLHLSIAGNADGGAGMVMVDIPQGLQHPVFAGLGLVAGDGALPAQKEAAQEEAAQEEAAQEASEPEWVDGGSAFVMSCTGPVVGNWPLEQDAVEVELLAEPVEEDPTVVQLVVAGTYADGSELDATFRLQMPSNAE